MAEVISFGGLIVTESVLEAWSKDKAHLHGKDYAKHGGDGVDCKLDV